MIHQEVRDLFMALNNNNRVYNKAYYKLTGSLPAAILLSHMCFLYSEAFDCKEFFQSDRQISETLGFSDRTLRTAKSHAKKYLTSHMVGLPSRNKWTLHEDELIGALASLR